MCQKVRIQILQRNLNQWVKLYHSPTSTGLVKSHKKFTNSRPNISLPWVLVFSLRFFNIPSVLPRKLTLSGLMNTNINFITHLDRQYLERLAAREEILYTHPNALKCLPSAISMVNELYTYLVNQYFPQRYPTVFTLHATHLQNNLTSASIPLFPPTDPASTLRILALNIDEDFLMLLPSPDGDGYSLQSFIWCYPVGFHPEDKLGLKLRDIHKPVPRYQEKLEGSMDRYFGKLGVGRVVYRVNVCFLFLFECQFRRRSRANF
jgi:hypothetical protein